MNKTTGIEACIVLYTELAAARKEFLLGLHIKILKTTILCMPAAFLLQTFSKTETSALVFFLHFPHANHTVA